MGIRFSSGRILLLIIGVIALIFALKFHQYEKIKEFLTEFNKYELAGYD